jgi:hypothetical protein
MTKLMHLAQMIYDYFMQRYAASQAASKAADERRKRALIALYVKLRKRQS